MALVAAETVVERIRRYVQMAIRAGKFENEAAFLRAIGRSDGYLGELASRTEDNRNATVRGDTAAKMAEVLGINVADILGAQDFAEQPVVDVYPNRAWAIKAARDLQLPEMAIQIVLRHEPGYDLERLTWFHRIEAEAESLRPASKR